MKRFFFLLALSLVGILTLQARPVDPSLAQMAASKFLAAAQLDIRGGTAEMVYAEPHGAFYVFKAGTSGFVIIAGDDAYRPVIGYSDESCFDASDIPPALADYLDGIAMRIVGLRNRGNAKASPMVAAEWESMLQRGQLLSRFGGKESSYFCQTQWNQDYPYNCCCPEDPDGVGGHAYVGCLATAMSQLMRFWAMPTQGIGSHCYVHEDYGEQCADFGNTVYDWDHMPNRLTSNSPEEEKLAVGTLCYHCGVTIDMGYGPDGSGGASGPIPGVMHDYFNYSEANVQLRRDDFDLETWKRMVREQFDMGWPMYYGGCQDGGCHAFVCDGYDDRDMYHFNLGWGGGSDGWYIIDEAPYTSPADAMFNFVPAEIYDITPSAPTGFSAEVPVETELRTLLHWTNPVTSLDNTPLASIEEVVVMRNNQVIQVLTGLNPGETVDIEDADIPYYGTFYYTVYVKANGRYGKHAYSTELMVGPSCQWKVVMTTSNQQGWNGGYLTVYNNAGQAVSHFTMASNNPTLERPVLPLGRLSFAWTAPEEAVGSMSFVIKDAQDQEVYAFNGSSDELEPGIFLEVNNAFGSELPCSTPENLLAVDQNGHILLTWDAVEDEGYGYNIYRDGLLFRLVPAGAGNTFYDEQATLGGHCYQVTVLCGGGESEEDSNEACASVGPCYPPRNLDFEYAQNFRIILTWEPPVPSKGLSGYAVYRKEGNGAYKRVKLLAADKLTFTDNTLHHDGDYYYRLYAYYEDLDCYSAPANRKYEANVFELHAYYSTTGVGENNVGVKVYPNPAKGRVSVQAEAMTHLTVFNVLGQTVLDQDAKGDSFEWHDMPQGAYLLRVETSHGVFFSKILCLDR